MTRKALWAVVVVAAWTMTMGVAGVMAAEEESRSGLALSLRGMVAESLSGGGSTGAGAGLGAEAKGACTEPMGYVADGEPCYPEGSGFPGACPCNPFTSECDADQGVCVRKAVAAADAGCLTDPDTCGMGYSCQVMPTLPNECLQYPRLVGQPCTGTGTGVCSSGLTCSSGVCRRSSGGGKKGKGKGGNCLLYTSDAADD